MGRRRRVLFAVVLALAVAGLGHAYLRRWARAVGWFGVIVLSGILLVNRFADPDAPVGELPTVVIVPIVVLFVLSAIDAYFIASRGVTTWDVVSSGSTTPTAGQRPDEAETDPDADDDTFTCPHCGRETDPDLDFCQWCTESFPADSGPTE